MSVYSILEQIAEKEFGDVVIGGRQVGRRANTPLKLRLDK
jgi:hypothetical protein